MKKCLFIGLASMLVGCQKVSILEELNNEEPTKTLTFHVCGWGLDTRGDLTADGKEMTDLWIFDYVDGECVQQIHQENDDEDFATPSIALAHGIHHLYFVASRGIGADLSTDDGIITWTSVRDTFWDDLELNVTSSSSGDQSVTLGRVITKFKMSVTDAVPVGCSSIIVEPSTWYMGINYLTGEAAEESDDVSVTISVPSSYIGTSQMQVSIFGFSDTYEWTTDVTVTAKDVNDEVIGSVIINDAPFKRNRSTNYTGTLFSESSTLDIGLDAEWLTPLDL